MVEDGGADKSPPFLELRNYGITELRKLRQTTSSAAATCSLVVSLSCSLLSDCEDQVCEAPVVYPKRGFFRSCL